MAFWGDNQKVKSIFMAILVMRTLKPLHLVKFYLSIGRASEGAGANAQGPEDL